MSVGISVGTSVKVAVGGSVGSGVSVAVGGAACMSSTAGVVSASCATTVPLSIHIHNTTIMNFLIFCITVILNPKTYITRNYRIHFDPCKLITYLTVKRVIFLEVL